MTTRLNEAYRRHLKRQEDLRDQLVVALRALNDEGCIPVLLKGASHLTRNDTAWHEARSMRDIDILVRHFDAEKSNQALLSLGYQVDHDPPPLDRHLPELRLPGRAGTVEIHTEALSFAARHALSTEEVWKHARSGNFSGASFFALPTEWHLLHGLLHHQLSDRGHARRMLALKGLWEFANVASDVSPTGWGTIIAHSEQRRVFPLLSSWAIQAHRLFGLSVPDALMTSKPGVRHAEATFVRARRSQTVRQALFLADKLSFAFAPATLAQRYKGGAPAASALRHVAFLWRRRRPMARRWLDH